MSKNNIIVFPPQNFAKCYFLFLVWPVYKTHSILASISEYKKCDLYANIYGIHFEFVTNAYPTVVW